MADVRLMDAPEDYKKLGVNPEQIEVWEDQRRGDDRPGHWEWWYFDAILDDGTAVVIQFLQKSLTTVNDAVGHPTVNFKITLPDGTHYDEMPTYPVDECEYGTGKCDVKFGSNTFMGDLKNYTIYVAPVNGIGADLHLTSLTQPFRPGTAYFDFGENGEQYYTWLCAVPKGEVSGSLTVGNKTINVHGFGYHDHQWGSMNYLMVWNHWTWARQSFEDYTLLVFDMVAARNYGFKRFPITFIQDKDGNIIFENTKDVFYEVLKEYHDDESGKDYPKVSRYVFNQGSKKVEYTLAADKILQSEDAYRLVPEQTRTAFDQMGMHPSYSRYLATGDLEIANGDETVRRSGQLIYEFMYPGRTYRERI